MNAKMQWRLAGVAMLALGATALAQVPDLRPLESSVETAANLISLPAVASGQLRVRECPDCESQSFALDPSISLIAAGKSYTLAQFAAYLSGAGSKPVTIHYRLSDSKVTRITSLVK